MPDLPRDILIDIFTRLPAKSLGRFKSVSRYWCSLISTPKFMKSHHRQAISAHANHSRIFVMSSSLQSVDYESPSCYEGVNNDPKAIVRLCNPMIEEAVSEKLFGSCYGLIYFVCYQECIVLWNPTTQQTRRIPNSSPLSGDDRFYGLGYDSSIEDYKLVRASRSVFSPVTRSEIFDLGSGSWRTIEASQIDINVCGDGGMFSNGAIHWLGTQVNASNKRKTILAFDVNEETFSKIDLPEEGNNEETGYYSLGDLRGFLYAVCGCYDTDVDVWVMNDYGVESSWSKLIRLNWAEFDCVYSLAPVCFLVGGDDVLVDLDTWDLVRYSLSDKSMQKVKKCSDDWHTLLVYMETLVSPYGYG